MYRFTGSASSPHRRSTAFPGLTLMGTLLVCSIWGLWAPRAAGDTPRLGNETQINGFTTGVQFVPDVADDGNGGRVVVWMSEFSPQDGSGYSIRARRFGNALGEELQVNEVTAGDQQWPAVDMGADGSFLVVWTGPGGDTGDGESVQGRLFAADGTPAGSQFQVNDYTTDNQNYPAVTLRSDGQFVVVWSSFGSPGDDDGTYSIQGRRFASDGTAQGASFQVNSYSTGDQTRPTVRWLGDDHFVVVWSSRGSAGDDTSEHSIQGRLFAADGTPLGEDLQINTYTTGGQRQAAVATSDDAILVVWSSVGSPGDDSDQSSIQGRRLSTDLVPLADQFQINSYTTSFQISTSVAALADGRFVTVWESLGSVGGDVADRSIQGQELSTAGLPDGPQFQINTFTDSYQLLPKIAADHRDGDYLVVWNSAGSFGDDNDSTSVQGQRFGRRLFVDGFESGDVGAWSSSTP